MANDENLEKGRETMKKRAEELRAKTLRRNKGNEPGHEAAGSEAWAKRRGFPDDTEDMPR